MDNKQIGERLQGLRQERRLTQSEFAESLGFSVPAYKNYERGVREIPASLLYKLHHAYGTDPLWLIDDDQTAAREIKVRPKHDIKMLETIGMAVEAAIAAQGIMLSSEKKWEIIGFLYDQAVRYGQLDRGAMSTLISVGGK